MERTKRRVTLLDKANLFYGTMNDLAQNILNNKKKKKYFAINTDCYNIAVKDSEYQKIILNPNNEIYIDGSGILLGQKITKSKIAKERIATTDLFVDLLEKANGNTFYLLGGTPGTAEKVIDNMQIKYPNAKLIGFHHGYFDKDRPEEIIKDINMSSPDILLVGFGCPIQEKWVVKHFDKINAVNFITCGGLFDYYAENVKRAPKWMQKFSLEWLYRFFQEPNRLFKRYFFGNTKFLINMVIKRCFNKNI